MYGKPGTQDQLGSAGIALSFLNLITCAPFGSSSYNNTEQYRCLPVSYTFGLPSHALCRYRVVSFVTEINYYLYDEGIANLYNESKAGSLYSVLSVNYAIASIDTA